MEQFEGSSLTKSEIVYRSFLSSLRDLIDNCVFFFSLDREPTVVDSSPIAQGLLITP